MKPTSVISILCVILILALAVLWITTGRESVMIELSLVMVLLGLQAQATIRSPHGNGD